MRMPRPARMWSMTMPYWMLVMVNISAHPQQFGNQGHAYVHAELGLLEVVGARVVVDVVGDLPDTGQRVHDDHILSGEAHLFGIQNVDILEADIVVFVEEALLLDAGHVQDVQVADDLIE